MSAIESLDRAVFDPAYEVAEFNEEAAMRPLEVDAGVFDIEVPRVIHTPSTTLYRGRWHIRGASGKFKLEVPDEILDPAALMVANGYCAFERTYHKLRHAVASNGKPAATVESKVFQKFPEILDKRHIDNPELLQCMAVGGVIKAVRELYGIKTIDLAGHSWGGQVAAKTAEHMPEDIRSIIFLASVGLDGHTLWLMLSKRLPKAVRRDILPHAVSLIKAGDYKSGISALKQLSNPVRRGLEGIAAGRADLRPNVRRLGTLGIKTFGVLYPKDEFFDMNKVLECSGDLLDDIVVHPNANMNHVGPQEDPVGTANIIRDLLAKHFPPKA